MVTRAAPETAMVLTIVERRLRKEINRCMKGYVIRYLQQRAKLNVRLALVFVPLPLTATIYF